MIDQDVRSDFDNLAVTVIVVADVIGERDAQRATAERTGTAVRIPTHQKEKVVGTGII